MGQQEVSGGFVNGGHEAIWAICRYQQIPNKSPKNGVLAAKIGRGEFFWAGKPIVRSNVRYSENFMT